VATKAADNGGRAAAVEKKGFCVFSILMSKKEASVRTAELFPLFSKYPVSIATVLNAHLKP
jgi:hypothetical protein